MRAAVAAAILIASAGAAEAAPKCLSKTEARMAYPGRHLYWTIDRGQRCWVDRRGRRRVRLVLAHASSALRQPAAAVATVSVFPVAPPPFVVLPAELAPPIQNDGRWRWITNPPRQPGLSPRERIDRAFGRLFAVPKPEDEE